jgi:DNA-binding CsgD family transcriptional regulator
MLKEVHTLEESREELESQLFLLDKKQKEGKFRLDDIGDFLPVGLLINSKDGSNIYMNQESLNHLNTTRDIIYELGCNYQSIIWYDPRDFNKIKTEINNFYLRNDESEIFSYFMRLKPMETTDYRWTYVSSKLLKTDNITIPTQRVLVATPINLMGQMSNKINRLLDENYYLKKNYKRFAALTKREKEIIHLLYYGYTNPQIADRLFISRYTVEQHRKNINRKLEIRTVVEMIKFAEVFDLI